jgi:hypothetical protein
MSWGPAWIVAVRRATLVALSSVVVLLLGACQGGAQHENGAQDAGEPGGDQGGDVELAHIHGLGINPADDDLYVASHHGVFHVPEQGEPEQIAGHTQDVMGFTIVGPDHFVASGHPGPGDTGQPGNLGLIESTDAARTWESVSLSGEADFHALEAKHNRVYGFDVVSGQLMVSEDRQQWDRRATVPMADIAVSPDDPDLVLATTEEGPVRSADGGRSFTVIEDAPTLVFVDWPATERLVGVDPDGGVRVSADGGANWAEEGAVPGRPAAILAHDEHEVYVATDEGIHHSGDNGATFTLVLSLS